jgi:hypothetical protein
MATILELANHAGLPAETVLRVILREPVNEDARRRVAAAIEALGPPDYPRPDGSIEVLPPDSSSTALATATGSMREDDALPERMRTELAEFVEVREPFETIVSALSTQRRERIEDLELITDLIVAGWRGVDRRLGRLEKAIARVDEAQRASQETARAKPNVIRFEPRSHAASTPEDAEAEPERLDQPS